MASLVTKFFRPNANPFFFAGKGTYLPVSRITQIVRWEPHANLPAYYEISRSDNHPPIKIYADSHDYHRLTLALGEQPTLRESSPYYH